MYAPSSGAQYSAAADGHDDFQRIAICQHFVRMAAARHDFAVTLDGDAFAREVQALDEFMAVQRTFELMSFAVDGKCNHRNSGNRMADEILAVAGRFGNRGRQGCQNRNCAFAPTR
jgi:hypothetical protein